MTAAIGPMALLRLININICRHQLCHKPCVGGGYDGAGAIAMSAAYKILLASAAVFGLAFGAERMFVPDVVPVAFAEGPQPLWSLETAFVLRAVELMAAGVAIIALVLMLAAWASGRRRTL
jgi:hypothetical protein